MRIPCALAAVVGLAAACLAGCYRGDFDEELAQVEAPGEELTAGRAYIRFRMNLSESGIPSGTRAGAAGTVEISGSSRENAINTLDLLIYDAETDNLESIIPLGKAQIAQISNSGSICLPISIYAAEDQRLRKVRIYAAANLTEKMRQLLTPGLSSKYFFVSTQSDYWKVIDEFVPGCVGKQELLESNGGSIPMTGQFITADGSADIQFSDAYTSEATALNVSADLCRMVAKVHVTAQAREFTLSDGQKASYVNAEDKSTTTLADPTEDYSNWIGWIRLANVRYMPNGVNKSTYLFPQPTGRSEYPLWMDRNMDLDNYVSEGQFNAPRWTRDFCFYNVMALHRENASPVQRLAQAEAYDADRLPGGAKEPYTRGMYCLENYFDTPQTNSDLFNRFEDRKNGDAIPMVSSVYIAAKLTPRNIVIVADYQARMDAFVDEFRNTPDEFREKYGLIESDFTQEDVELWGVLKERYKEYFTGDAAVYRGTFRLIRTVSEKDAAAIINWSLMCNELWSGDDTVFENGKYPAATFYVYDTDYDLPQALDEQWTQQYLYLTAGAVASSTDANMRIKTYSVPHLGGWGYYYSYLDQTGQTVDGRAPYTASQVTRNTYYLITVGNFGVPGGTITRPEYIKVNTVPVGWDYGGKGDIDLH